MAKEKRWCPNCARWIEEPGDETWKYAKFFRDNTCWRCDSPLSLVTQEKPNSPNGPATQEAIRTDLSPTNGLDPFVINLDSEPSVPSSSFWKTWYPDRSCGLYRHEVHGSFRWAQDQVHLCPCKEMLYPEMCTSLRGMPILNANVLDWLLVYQHRIPSEWKEDSSGRRRYVFFWTVYRSNDDAVDFSRIRHLNYVTEWGCGAYASRGYTWGSDCYVALHRGRQGNYCERCGSALR